MPFPGSSDYPDSVDADYGSGSARVDNVNVVYDDDFNFPDIQIRRMQEYFGTDGQLIGVGVAGKGIGGALSSVASGGTGFQFAARAAFASGTLLSIGDNYDAAYTEKMRLNYAGLLWTLGGADFGSGEFFRIPHGDTLPLTFEEGRLFHKDDENTVYRATGAAWESTAGVGGFEADFIDRYEYTQPVSPFEETLGSGLVDGSRATGGVVFWVMMDPTFSVGGTADVKLYDVGPKAGPLTGGILIATLQATSGGLAYYEQVLNVDVTPGANQIQDTERMYEATVEQVSSPGDTVFVGCGGIGVR